MNPTLLEEGMMFDEWLAYRTLLQLRRQSIPLSPTFYAQARSLALAAFRERMQREPDKFERVSVIAQASVTAIHAYLQDPLGLGILYTISYTAKDAKALIEHLAKYLHVRIGDIRSEPTSQLMQWRQPALTDWLGDAYWHIHDIGDLQGNQPGPGVCEIVRMLHRGENVALMCRCEQIEGCDVKGLADMIVDHYLPELSVVYLFS